MRKLAASTLISLLAAGPLPGIAQESDMASERARLANQRIETEAQRQAQIDAESQQEEALPAEPVATGTDSGADVPPPATAPVEQTARTAPPPADRADMNQVLEQLRELGALKDAGYLTDEEFAQLKQRILGGSN